MSTTLDLVASIKKELKAAQMTYADLAVALGMAESSVKRMLARGEMPLSRIDQICSVLGTDFAELARQVAVAQPPVHQLTEAQEAAVVADPKLLLVAICTLSRWTAAQMVASYQLTEAEVVARLARLDRLGVIELKAHNRYRLRTSKTLRWRPDGPVMRFFRERVVSDYFAAGFDGPGEWLSLVHGEISALHATQFSQRLQRLAEDFAQAHLDDQALPDAQKLPFTMVSALRTWVFAAFQDLRRPSP